MSEVPLHMYGRSVLATGHLRDSSQARPCASPAIAWYATGYEPFELDTTHDCVVRFNKRRFSAFNKPTRGAPGGRSQREKGPVTVKGLLTVKGPLTLGQKGLVTASQLPSALPTRCPTQAGCAHSSLLSLQAPEGP